MAKSDEELSFDYVLWRLASLPDALSVKVRTTTMPSS
jgi:hypothetical protein